MDCCLGLRRGETVVVIGDLPTRNVADALWEASRERGADPVSITVEERLDGEPPPSVAAALAAADVFIVPTRGSLSHTKARKTATDCGARGATLPGVTAGMLVRTMAIDLDAMRARGEAVAQLLTEADSAHLTCARGTDLVLDLTGRQGRVDGGELTAKHAFGNLPAGEGFIAPKGGHGLVAVMSVNPAGVLPGLVGILPEPMMLTVEDGQLAAGEGPYSREFLDLLHANGPNATNLADLGVGTNDAAVLTGNMLEDEKVVGTAHVAFGASDAIGGTVYAPIHRDVLVFEATLDIGDTRVLDQGRWMLNA